MRIAQTILVGEVQGRVVELSTYMSRAGRKLVILGTGEDKDLIDSDEDGQRQRELCVDTGIEFKDKLHDMSRLIFMYLEGYSGMRPEVRKVYDILTQVSGI